MKHKNQDSVPQVLDRDSQSSLAHPSRTIVHAKLEMTEPGDHDEQEADAVANAIVSGGKISRKISGGGGSSGIAVSQQMESQLSQLQGGGRQMPEGLRNMMESGFGQDFSQVRLHTDSEAANMSSSIHAKAFTLDNDIYFNQGQFSPNTAEGQRLVAHELTHVVQGTGKVGRQDPDILEASPTTETDNVIDPNGIQDPDGYVIIINYPQNADTHFEKLRRIVLFDNVQVLIDLLIDTAKNEVGYIEKESNDELDDPTANQGPGRHNNYVKYTRDLEQSGWVFNDIDKAIANSKSHTAGEAGAWCDWFVHWCFVKAFHPMGFERKGDANFEAIRNSILEYTMYENKYYGRKDKKTKEHKKDLLRGSVRDSIALFKKISDPKYDFKINGTTHEEYYGKELFIARDQGQPNKGDVVFFKGGHIGLVIEVSSNKISTIEGNTDEKEFSTEGIGVFIKHYYPTGKVEADKKEETSDVETSAGETINVDTEEEKEMSEEEKKKKEKEEKKKKEEEKKRRENYNRIEGYGRPDYDGLLKYLKGFYESYEQQLMQQQLLQLQQQQQQMTP